jgi:hypothetical protein
MRPYTPRGGSRCREEGSGHGPCACGLVSRCRAVIPQTAPAAGRWWVGRALVDACGSWECRGFRLGQEVTARPAGAADCARRCPFCVPGVVVYNTFCGINPMGLSDGVSASWSVDGTPCAVDQTRLCEKMACPTRSPRPRCLRGARSRARPSGDGLTPRLHA